MHGLQLVYGHALFRATRASVAFLSATALPLVVVIIEIGLETKRMKPADANADAMGASESLDCLEEV